MRFQWTPEDKADLQELERKLASEEVERLRWTAALASGTGFSCLHRWFAERGWTDFDRALMQGRGIRLD